MFELRSFRDGDAKAIWRLHDVALEEAGVHGGHGPWEDDLRDIRAAYLESGGDFLVGLFDGELVAMGGLLRHSPEEAEIKRMRVHPGFQRRGLGRRLLEQLEERAQALGCRAIRLDTTDQQTSARRLYESAGYRETGRRKTTGFLFIDFAKTLDPPNQTGHTYEHDDRRRPPEHPARSARDEHGATESIVHTVTPLLSLTLPSPPVA